MGIALARATVSPWESTGTAFALPLQSEWPAPQHESLPLAQQPHPQDLWQRIQRQGQIRVGVDPSVGEGYLYADPEKRTYAGFEWDILQAIAAELGVELQPIYIPWSQQLQSLTQDEVDLILGAREAHQLDLQGYLITQPYYLSPQRLVISAEASDPPERLAQLFGRKVGIVVSSTGAALLETYNQSRGNPIRLFATSRPERLFDQLRSGQLDAIVVDQPVATAALSEPGPPLRLSGPPLFPQPLVGVVAPGQLTLLERLNQSMTSLKGNGTLKQILEEWQLWDPTLNSPPLTKD
ncbi:MAG: amino acid ABC transporter substrate-binding protein [Synechococcaceae cyanobacterium SM2_3_1]|nr:amino acid ABC transporter substrate-binding protein [Synechococcaceae cyanobacterium SM2_3_1]